MCSFQLKIKDKKKLKFLKTFEGHITLLIKIVITPILLLFLNI